MTTTTLWLFSFLALYWAYCLYWGVVGARHGCSSKGFLLADRKLPSWVFALSATGMSFSGWTMLGQPAFIFRDGFQYAALALSAITIPLTGVLFAKRQWILSKRYQYVTQAEMLGDYFGGEGIRLLVLLVAVTFAIPFLGMQLSASGYLIQVLSDGAVPWRVAMWVCTVALFIYVCLGGLRSAAYVGVLQCLLLAAGMVAIGVVAYVHLGGFGGFSEALARFAAVGMGPLGAPAEGYNAYFEMPGVIQFVAGLGKEAPTGGVWTAAMVLSYSLALMGIQASPAFSIWVFSSRDTKGFGPQQVWVSGLGVGVILVFFVVAQGMGANLLGGSAAVNAAGLSVAPVLPVLADGKQSSLVSWYIHSISLGPWFKALLALCALAAIQAMTSAFAATAGAMFARDVYRRYFASDASDGAQKLSARIAIGITLLGALLLATYVPHAQVSLGSLALGFGCQLVPALAAACWMPFITRAGATVGLAAGLVAVVLTDSLGGVLAGFFGFELPWGRWPWTIHSAGWGLFVNIVLCLLVSLVTQRAKDSGRRAASHEFLAEVTGAPGDKRFLRPVAWTLVLVWIFFALGPGAVIGNYFFTRLDGGAADWAFGMPSIWVWQVIWWAFGILVLWLLAYRLGMSTSPRGNVEPESVGLRAFSHGGRGGH